MYPPTPPQCAPMRYKKKKNLVTCTKEKKQNLKWKETRELREKRGKRRGKCNFNGKEACKKPPRKGEQNKEPQNPNSPFSPKTKRIKKEKKKSKQKNKTPISNEKKKKKGRGAGNM